MNFKHILHITGSMTIGGAPEHIRVLCNGLRKLGYTNVLVCSDNQFAQLMRQNGYKVYTVDFKKQWSSISSIYKIIKQEKIYIVHTIHYYGDKRGLLAAKLARVPIILTAMQTYINVDDYRNPKMNFPYWVYNNLLAYIPDRLIACSEAIQKHTIKQLKINPKRVVTVHNGTDLKKVSSIVTTAKEKIRREFNLVSNEKYIGINGRLDMEKGHKYLFQAIPLIANEIDKLKLFVVGDGYARAYLNKLAQELGILDRVIFAGWRLDSEAIMSCMDVIVVPSLAEPFGLVITEAMALSKPVVASNTGGIPEIIVDGETGILVPPKDSQSLAQAIKKILQDEKMADQMGQKGRKRVYEKFNADILVKNMVAVYQKIAHEKFGTA